MIKRNPFSRLLGMVLCICMVLSMLPGIPLVANAAEATTMKIYFRNDWNWSDIKIYFWGSETATNPGWPGYSMSYYGSSNNQAYYVYEVPTDVTGIIVSGNNGSKRDQSPDITSGWYDGITYYMFWDNRNTVKSFNIRDVFACKHPNTQTVAGYAATCTEDGLSDGQKCTECGEMAVAQTVIPAKGHSFADGICSVCGAERYMDVYFRNDWNWTDIKLYFWGSQTDTNPEWSGNPMTFFDNDGSFDYFVMSVPTDVIGIVINGIKDDGSGALDQSPDIESGWYDGITYYMHWDGGNAVSSFNISDVKFPCKHSWNDATCTTPKTCSVCGETEGEALGHGYNYDCDTNCVKCGELTRPEAIHVSDGASCKDGACIYGCGTDMPAISNHDWNCYYEQAPTCSYDGVCYYECLLCGETYEDYTPALGHEKPVYTNNGATHDIDYPCCDDEDDSGVAHSFVDGQCACGAPESINVGVVNGYGMADTITLSNTVATPGQDYVTVISSTVGTGIRIRSIYVALEDSWCGGVGIFEFDAQTNTLTVFGDYVAEGMEIEILPYVTLTGHLNGGSTGGDYWDYVFEPDENGKFTYTKYCGDVDVLFAAYETCFVREGYKLAGYNTAADGNGTAYALDAAYELTEDLEIYLIWGCDHQWLDATCTAPKTCSVCGETEGDVDLDNHTSTDYTYKYYRNRYFNSHEKFHACCGVSVGMENHSYNEQTGLCNECGAEILIIVEMLNAPTEYLNDVEYALGRGGRSATLLKDHTNTKSYSVAVDALYFAEGVTLTNNGTLVMPENFDLSTLVNNYNGTGVVIVGDASYVWNGEKFICAGEHTPGNDGICVLCGERVTFDIWVQDIQVTVGNAADVLGNLDEGATVTYDAATNTLYLNNATIGGAEVGIKAGGDLNLHITGNNSITTVESESATHGIYTNIGVLTIDGTGSLHIQCAAAVSASYGIVADNGLHIKGGSVTAIAGNASISIGVKTAISRIVTVDSGAALTASGDPNGRFFGNGIVTKTVTGEGTVNAIATLTPNADENDHTEYLVIYGNVTLAEDAPSMGFYQVMEGAVLTVAEGIVLDMSNITADKITLDGTIVNNGTVVLPDSYTYATIPTAITGGIVTIGESSYIWNGSKYICVNHSWVDATCTTLKTCSVCGATEGEKADHRFENGMCVYGCGTVQTFTVTYAGYGTEHLRSETVDFNTTIQLPQAFFGCNPIGYVFVEFNTQPDGSGESYREFDWYRVTGDVTLYARWAELAIGGGFLNSGEYMDLQGNVTVTQPDGGYAYFDNGTLTLHDFSYTGAGNRIYYRTQILMTNIYYHMGHLNLVLEGENSLTNTAVEGFSVLSENELTVSGSGSLTAKADFITVYSQTSIHVESGTMDLTGGYLAVGAINGITIENAQLLIPENGSVQADANQHYIADSEGNMATSVVIAGVHTHSDADNSGRCDICNELMQPAKICFATASLEGKIAINFYTLLSDKVAADPDAYMQFIMADGSVIEVYVRDAVSGELNGETYYVFTCSVNAKEMADDVLCRFFYEGGSTAEVIYNVKTYGNYIINEHDDASAKALAEAMLNYGAASQLHFGHNTDNLANADLQTPDYSDVVIEGYDAEAGQGTDLAKLYSASLILKSETTLRFFFQVDSSVESFTVTMNGQALEVKVRGGLYYVDVVGIAAKDLNKAVTITINDGTTTADVSFNPMSYCQGVQNDTTGAFSDEMKDLVASLYLYNQAANEYFKEG